MLGAVPHVARLCCCDDQGHAGCVVGLATVSGEASGGDVMNREVKRHSRQEARREKDNITDCIHNTHSVCLYCGSENHFTAGCGSVYFYSGEFSGKVGPVL